MFNPPLLPFHAQKAAQAPKLASARPAATGSHAMITGYAPVPTKACGSTAPCPLSTKTFFTDTEQAAASKQGSLGLYPEGYPDGPTDHSTFASGRPASRNLNVPAGPGADKAAPMKTHTRRQAAAAKDKVRRLGVVQSFATLASQTCR